MKNNEINRKVSLIVAILITTVAISQTAPKQLGNYDTYPKIKKELLEVDVAKNNLKEFVLKHQEMRIVDQEGTSNFMINEVLIDIDGIEFMKGKNKISISYDDLIGRNVIVENIPYCYVRLKNIKLIVNARKTTDNDCNLSIELAKYLKAIQHYYFWQKANEDLEKFKSVATAYNNLANKPSISEEQRKYIVQANGLSEQKMFKKAIELYKKAIEVNSVSYPAAYSNMALLYAQSSNFQSAIHYMKKYLMLVPHAEDARSAQDKIYLWETQL